MAIKDFEEKEIRYSILRKIKPEITHKGKHWKGSIYLEGRLIGKVKIPNNHKRIMKQNKSKFIAAALNLTHTQFNDLVDCTLNNKEYYQLMRNYL